MSERYTSLLMSVMKKRIVAVGDELWEWAGAHVIELGISRAALVRRLLREERARTRRKKVRR